LSPFVFFLLALKASLFSTGGLGNVPSLHADLVARGWATERAFAESLAVGQVSPGPNGLWVVSLGYLLGGLRGALLALLAICLPPLLILAVDRLYRRVQHHPAVEGFVQGLALSVVGVFAVVMWGLLRDNGIDVRSVLIALASLGLGATGRVPVLVLIALAALVGIALR
jgi:chromate transporter